MAKQKSSGWLDKYTAAVSDATAQAKPGPVFLGNPYAKEMAKRQTYLNPQGKSTAPAMKQAALDRAKSEKTTDLNKKIASYAQNIGGALELAAPFTGPAMPILGAIGTGLDVGGSAYLAAKDISEGNYGSAAMNAGFGALGAAGFAPMVKYNRGLNAAVNTVDDVSDIAGLYNSYDNLGREYAGKVNNAKNLEDLNYAKQFAEQYGYKLPEDLQRVAQSNELTNRTIRGMMDRHNTFARGTSTNWDVIGKKNPEILKHLEQQGIDWKNNPKAAAEYMATHVPIETGYGRANIGNAVFSKGQDALYTSNSIPTAEGYTYGQGFITKAKRPTDYSSLNRKDWIDKNTFEYYTNSVPYEGDNFSNVLVDGLPVRNQDFPSRLLYDPEKYKSIDDFKNALIQAEEEAATSLVKTYDKYKDTNPQLYQIGQKNYDWTINTYINNLKNQKWEPSPYKGWTPDFSNKIIRTDYNPDNKYAHYLHLGNPGEQVLQPIKSWEITPETWVNQSRSHINIPTDKLSRAAVAPLGIAAGESMDQKKNGGWLDKYDDGGPVQPNYNDASVSYPDNFVGEGTINGPNWKSPAWGGQFAMGGSMPGAVGFTYARTINPAPSNGPYAKKTKASAENGTEMKFYQEGLDWTPKTISKNGSVIKDDMGQWAHPGEVTEIGSNQITMQGVPYPVLGISDTGDTQMMYPNQEYQYSGSSVTEYPMMKEGGALQLIKLDQLTNFTNYNTKQPGGWLDKYQD